MPRHSHLRDDRDQADHSVSSLELFFDLVFVFAVTQLSHYLLGHHTIVGALQTLVLFMAVATTLVAPPLIKIAFAGENAGDEERPNRELEYEIR